MEKNYNYKAELMCHSIKDVALFGEFSIDEMPNISENWVIIIEYKRLEKTEEVDELTLKWINNPYKIISEVEEKDIEFLAVDGNEYDQDGNIIGERMCHRERIKWKKDIFAHRHLLNELCTNANIDITNHEVNYTYEEWHRNSLNRPIEAPKF